MGMKLCISVGSKRVMLQNVDAGKGLDEIETMMFVKGRRSNSE